jgi:hypothetical protein
MSSVIHAPPRIAVVLVIASSLLTVASVGGQAFGARCGKPYRRSGGKEITSFLVSKGKQKKLLAS